MTTSTDSSDVPKSAGITATATLADLQAGMDVLIHNCGKCHNLYNPDSFSASGWKSIIPIMASKAGLSTIQTAQVLKYVPRGN